LIIHDFEGYARTGTDPLDQALQRLLLRPDRDGWTALEEAVIENDVDARLAAELHQGIGRQALLALKVYTWQCGLLRSQRAEQHP